MSHKLLLPNKYKLIGWFLLIPSTILGIYLSFNNFNGFDITVKTFSLFSDELFGKTKFLTFVRADITNTIVGVLFIIGALMVSFSKEKNEDEFIANLRLSSLLWAVLVNYFLLLIGILFIYDLAFINVMTYNMFTVLIIFIIRFNYILYKNNKMVSDEK
ncbi:MAG: hypothetical protein K2Y12_13690 [Chitinophagaceae bacterium]|nr:hypothetical protein [Chitinophagaceae bacterium]